MRIPPFVLQTAKFLKGLFMVFDQHLLHLQNTKVPPEEWPNDEKVVEFNDILDSIYNPVINVSRKIAARLPQDKAAVYVVNCFSFMLAALKGVPFASKCFPIYDILETLTEEALGQLIQLQATSVLERLGMPAGKTETDVVAVVQRLYTFAASSTATKLPLVTRISSSALEQRATTETLEKIVACYESLITGKEGSLPTGLEVRSMLSMGD
eukprot:Protomagalhaensia_wolfi_Nauph_80__2280@NODE_248_length_3062_cov_279_865035_g176_i1_p2_GENE_NODE_248_length_3062_cov_279_865035_g176_i1NODE_248_length_3062_cov_279_865035_g176_i1_p2_ORF_typecomplete_len211_score26_74COG6/PF06419_11/7e22_NODE_248_length_3062_cov_279_865035_g176_i118222454